MPIGRQLEFLIRLIKLEKTKVTARGSLGIGLIRDCWIKLPGPPLGWRLCGVVGLGRAIHYYSGLQLVHICTPQGLPLGVTVITILSDENTSTCDKDHRQGGHSPANLTAILKHKTTQEKQSWPT
jgi:hypothetical protein